MMLPMILLGLLIVVLPDAYIWRMFLMGHVPMVWQMMFLIPNAVAVVMLVSNLIGLTHGGLSMRIFYTIFLCIALPKLAFALFSLIGLGIGYFVPCIKGYANMFAICIGFVTCCAFVFGYAYGWKHVTVKHRTIRFERLPESFDGYRIVHLSDFHCGTFRGNEQVMARMVEKVNRMNPDMIVFTGDLVNTSPDELDGFHEILSSLKAKDGVYSIMGNHDYCEYKNHASVAEIKHDIDRIKLHERIYGWQLLLNENLIIHRGNDSIVLIGVENAGLPPFKDYSDLPKAMTGLKSNEFKILLSHDPTQWRRQIVGKTDIDLMLAGHTHGAQIKLGDFSPSSFKYREWGGMYKEKSQILNVSLGIGGRVPFRLGAWPEIDLIVLRTIKYKVSTQPIHKE